MSAAIKQTINHWGYLLPYTHIPRTESEYEKLLHFVDELMGRLRFEPRLKARRGRLRINRLKVIGFNYI
jgi:hypothetical protein